jgi:outer membrane protein TolC
MSLVRAAAPRCKALVCAALMAAVISGSAVQAQDRAAPQNPQPTRSLTLDSSVEFALENNPQLMALRQQHGIAAAGVVIAKTYPFNPIYQGSYQHAQGPTDAPVLNSFLQQHQVTLEVQLLHQQRYRQQAAFAALSRTDWEIAAQELTFAVNTVRAFDGLLYRQGKLAVTEEFLKLNQQGADEVKQLIERGTFKSGDLIISRAEVSDIQSQLGLNRTAIITARRDYYRALGIADGSAEPTGSLERAAPTGDANLWLAAAHEMRPDQFAKMAAVREAAADVRVQRTDRFGNPQVGPFYQFNESQVTFIGAQLTVPLPILNCHPGEIRQAEARRSQAQLNLREIEVEIWQDVTMAAANVDQTRRWVENYRDEVIPSLRKGLADMDLLLQQGQGGADVLRVLDVRRKLLRAQDGYLDALLAYTSALADLAQAVGDPGLAMGKYESAATPPETLPLPPVAPSLKQP